LAIGASPIMAHAEEELPDLLAIANALVINIGTLDVNWISSMKQAMQLASVRKIPIVLDPVGAGASHLRTDTCKDLFAIATPSVIRGNASEILALAGMEHATKGVESVAMSHDAKMAALKLTTEMNCVICVSGAIDWCFKNNESYAINNGVALMTRITGMGCMATALTAAFCAVNQNHLHASLHAMAVMGIAGELAAEKASGPGSFAWQFLDALYNIDEEAIAKKLHVM
jgi:hydroxyethylthiazole kinase